MTAAEFLGLVAIGIAAGLFGPLVGMGGGFVIIPLLRIFYGTPPTLVSGTSLVFVLANAASSTVGYLRRKRVDVPLAVPLSIGGLPGSIVGVFALHLFTPRQFDMLYGCNLIFLALLTLWQRSRVLRAEFEPTFAHRLPVALAAGFGVGFFSSLFGIGGGVVLVPLLLIGARMPPHIVAATSGFVVLFTAPVGIAAHALQHDVDWAQAVPLIVGGFAGGAFAPAFARRVSSPRLVTLLAVALIAAALSLALRHFL